MQTQFIPIIEIENLFCELQRHLLPISYIFCVGATKHNKLCGAALIDIVDGDRNALKIARLYAKDDDIHVKQFLMRECAKLAFKMGFMRIGTYDLFAQQGESAWSVTGMECIAGSKNIEWLPMHRPSDAAITQIAIPA